VHVVGYLKRNLLRLGRGVFVLHKPNPLGVPFLPAWLIGSPLLYKPRNIEVLHKIFFIVSLKRSSASSVLSVRWCWLRKSAKLITEVLPADSEILGCHKRYLLVRYLWSLPFMTISIVVLYNLRRYRNAFKQPANQF
jgi:hypothetical protein